ncbi:MAG: 3TM-type holin [Bacteroidota bacterium]
MADIPVLSTVLDLGKSILDRVIPDPVAREAAKQEMERLAQAGELQREQLALQRFGMVISDRADARLMQRETGGRVAPALAIATFCGFFLVLALMIFFEIPESAQRPFDVMLGALTTLLLMVASFYFGSSEGSKSKERLLAQRMEEPSQSRTVPKGVGLIDVDEGVVQRGEFISKEPEDRVGW